MMAVCVLNIAKSFRPFEKTIQTIDLQTIKYIIIMSGNCFVSARHDKKMPGFLYDKPGIYKS